jgi:hypothetical protein
MRLIGGEKPIARFCKIAKSIPTFYCILINGLDPGIDSGQESNISNAVFEFTQYLGIGRDSGKYMSSGKNTILMYY